MVDVVDEVVHGRPRGLAGFQDQGTEGRQRDDTSAFDACNDLVVVDVARVRRYRVRIRVSEHDRVGALGDDLDRGVPTDVRTVDEHSQPVAFLHYQLTEASQAALGTVKGAVGDAVRRVV